MPVRIVFTALFMLFLIQLRMLAQQHDTIFDLTAFVYDDLFIPVPATHVINLNTHKGDVTDSLGIFRLPVHLTDTLLIRNIAFRDTLVPVMEIQSIRHIRLKRRHYRLQEVKIFEWGATYDDFREAFIEMPMQQNLGATLGLPRQDPNYIPDDMNEEYLKSPLFLIRAPVSFFYYNFSKHAKSARKVYWIKRNQKQHDLFNEIMNSDNISSITALTGVELQKFLAFLYERMVCDFNCSELAIYKEIYGLWKVYQELEERGMLIK